MLVQSTSNPDTFWALPDYYMIAQFSKFVQPGAKRVARPPAARPARTNVAFQNPDGSLVTVVVNQTASNQPISVRVGTQQFSATLPAKTVGTYVWAGATSGTPTSARGPDRRLRRQVRRRGRRVDRQRHRLQLYTCNGTNAQSWTVGSDGTVQALGKCLDVAAACSANGTKVQLYDCNGTAAQQWTPERRGTLRSLGKCLDATGPSSADGTKLQIWDCGSRRQPEVDAPLTRRPGFATTTSKA